MDNVLQYRDKLEALLADTPMLTERKRNKALKCFDQALMEVSRYVLDRELQELQDLAYEKTDLDKEADLLT